MVNTHMLIVVAKVQAYIKGAAAKVNRGFPFLQDTSPEGLGNSIVVEGLIEME